MGWPLVLSLQPWLCPPSLVVTLTVIMTMLMVLSVRLAKVELVDTLLPEMILLATVTMLSVASEVVETREAAPVIGIRSQNFDGPLPEFRYAFETENDIKQEASGELRNVDGADVVVMKGSYSYVGADGLTYQVDWYADETGYHPSAPHLPQPVQPIHPEIVAAVEAQLRFAAEEEAAAAASARSETYAAPLAGYSASL